MNFTRKVLQKNSLFEIRILYSKRNVKEVHQDNDKVVGYLLGKGLFNPSELKVHIEKG